MARGLEIAWLRWTPRVLGFLFAAFIGLFALDALGTGEPWWRQLAGFENRMVPALLVVLAVVAGRRWPSMGGVLCLGLGLLYAVVAWGRIYLATDAIALGPVWACPWWMVS